MRLAAAWLCGGARHRRCRCSHAWRCGVFVCLHRRTCRRAKAFNFGWACDAWRRHACADLHTDAQAHSPAEADEAFRSLRQAAHLRRTERSARCSARAARAVRPLHARTRAQWPALERTHARARAHAYKQCLHVHAQRATETETETLCGRARTHARTRSCRAAGPRAHAGVRACVVHRAYHCPRTCPARRAHRSATHP